MIILKLDRKNKTPLFRQIYQQLKEMIENKTLPPGYPLPSTRRMAERHGIDRSTVYKAYEELWAMGYIQSRPGAYSIVRKRQQLAGSATKKSKGLICWEKHISHQAEALHRVVQNLPHSQPGDSIPRLVDFTSLRFQASHQYSHYRKGRGYLHLR